ncbi:phosphoserine phosphatase SerB [Stappia sp. 28M-7]|uniref:phosphoserine phosphatase SerB n=1 Tax=Stappia sp. 28M-7 TaxID=2762596 RepID=UPI00163C36DA|nr:phosphoserine phosphatase SerB [Stappia sp. 28M-7]
MSINLVAVGNPAGGVSAFEGIGAITGTHQFEWLSAGRAALYRTGRPLDATCIEKARNLALSAEIDLFVTRKPIEKKAVLVADMEATIILDEMLDLLAEELDLGDAVANITSLAMNGKIDFGRSLAARTALFAGTPESLLERLCERMRFTPGAQRLVTSMKNAGARTVLVTGGYDMFAEKVRDACGFDEVVANRPEVRDGMLTGQLLPPICTAATKREVLERTCSALGLPAESACAVGDGANDMEMLKIAGLPASYRGKPVLRDLADFNIVHGDLTALLFAQGYRESEISN